jgi:TolB-like protein/Tfp pilus assembly protein PilF
MAINPAVFLSYASQDTEPASQICDALRAAGIVVWFDKTELRGGDAWDLKIRGQIQQCALFVPIISVNTNARQEGYFRLEWKLAVDRSHFMADDKPFLVPILVDATLDVDARVPEKFRQVQWMRLLDGATPPTFARQIHRLLSEETAGNAPVMEQDRGLTFRQGSTISRSTRYAALMLVGAAVLMGGFYAVDKALFFRRSMSVSSPAAPPQASPRAPVIAPEKSIAVLPFVDMSEKHDQQYFSDGLTEELINQLAQLSELKVIARTSSFQFRNESEDIRAIAGKLGVANLLEGSVRKVAKKLRITVQLIRAADGVHLWSYAYDRDETDVFKIQTEIATAVANSLRVSLVTSAVPWSAGTSNLEAYNWFLQGVLVDRQAHDRADFLRAVEYLRKAIQADPTYAQAYAALAHTLAEQEEFGFGPAAALTDEARSAAMHAVELNARIPETHTALAKVLIMNDWNFKLGQEELDKVLQIDPNHSLALTLAGQLAMYRGNLDTAVDLRNKAILYDPANPWRYLDLAVTLFYQRRYVESLAAIRHMQDLDPRLLDHMWVGEVLLAMGDPGAAIAEMDRESKEDSRSASSSRVLAYDALGKRSDADAALAILETKHATETAYGIGRVYANRNDLDQAFQWFDRAYRQHDDGLITIKLDPLLKNVQTDPRFRTLIQKLTLPD